MAIALRIKGSNTLIRYDKRYADEDRFELIEDVEAFMASLKAPPKKARRTRKKAATTTPAEPATVDQTDELAELLAGINSGEEDPR